MILTLPRQTAKGSYALFFHTPSAIHRLSTRRFELAWQTIIQPDEFVNGRRQLWQLHQFGQLRSMKGGWHKQGWRHQLQVRPYQAGLSRPRKDETGKGSASATEKSLIKETLRTKLLSSFGSSARENIYTIPNTLTFSRLIAAPVVGYLVLTDQHAWALGLFAYAGITDLIDGYIARTWRQQTVVGTVIDPMADKTLMTILTVCLAIKGGLPVWLATIILGRDVGMGIAAIYYRWISLPPPKTFTRYWDFSLPSAEVHPTSISKVNTALQLALIGACTAQPLLATTLDISTALTAMQYIVATTTIWSGASYIYTKDAVKILTDKERADRARTRSEK